MLAQIQKDVFRHIYKYCNANINFNSNSPFYGTCEGFISGQTLQVLKNSHNPSCLAVVAELLPCIYEGIYFWAKFNCITVINSHNPSCLTVVAG